jgi:hypothetical protein
LALNFQLQNGGTMIDKVRLEVPNFSLPYARKDVKHTIEYGGLEFTNQSSYFKDGTCYTTKFVCHYQNLYLQIIPDKNLFVVENSLHHYYNRDKGIGNSDDFALSDVRTVIQELSDRLALNLDEALIKELEFGVNIPVNALEAYSGLISHKGKGYEPMKSGRQTYGACCKMDQFKIKAYDKRKQLRLQKRLSIDDEVFRFEVAVTNMSWLQQRKEPIPMFFGRDLYDYEAVQYLVHELVSKFNDSVRKAEIELSGLSLKDWTAIARTEHKGVSSMMERYNKHTRKKDSIKYNKLLKRSDRGANVCLLQRLIREKAIELLHT